MTKTMSARFRKSSKDVDDEFLAIQPPHKNHRSITHAKHRTEARDDLCSLSSLEESVKDDGTINEAKKVDDEEMFVPVVKLVDSFNKWIFNDNDNDNDNHSCCSVNDGSCTSNDDDSFESASCTSSQGHSSASSSCCSSVDNSTLGWSQTSSVKHSHKFLSTIQNEAEDHKRQKRSAEHLDEASLSTSVAESMWDTDSRNYALAEVNRRAKNKVVDFDRARLESDALGSYITDDEDNDTLLADLDTFHLRDQTHESSCVGNDAAMTIRDILKDFRESSCMEPKTKEPPRCEEDDEAMSYLGAARPKSKVPDMSVPETITAKRKTVLPSSPKNGDTKHLDAIKAQQLETRRLPNFSTSGSGRNGLVHLVTPLASNRPDHVGGQHASIERITRHEEGDEPTSAKLQDARNRKNPAFPNKNESSHENKEIDSNVPTNHNAGKHSPAKRLVASLRRARLAWKDKGPRRMDATRTSKKVKHTVGKENTLKQDKNNVHFDTNTRDEEVPLGTLDNDGNWVTSTDSFEFKRKNYSCLGDRFMFLISGCTPTKLEQVQNSPSNVTEFGRFPIVSTNSCDPSSPNQTSVDERSFEPMQGDHMAKEAASKTTANPLSNMVPCESERAATVPRGSRRQKMVATLTRRLQQVPTKWGNSARGEKEPEEAKNTDSNKDNNKATSPQFDMDAVESTSKAVESNVQERIEQGESLQLDGHLDCSSDACIEKSLEDYRNDIAPKWRPFDASFTKYPWHGLVVFSRRPSGVLSSEGHGESVYGANPSGEEDIETGFGGQQGTDWPGGAASNDDLEEYRQGIEAVIDTKSWKHLERLQNVHIIDGDESPAATDRKASTIKSLKLWSQRLLQENQRHKPVDTYTSSTDRYKVDHWDGLVAVRGNPQVLMIQTRNYNPRDHSTASRLAMKNARSHLRGLY